MHTNLYIYIRYMKKKIFYISIVLNKMPLINQIINGFYEIFDISYAYLCTIYIYRYYQIYFILITH